MSGRGIAAGSRFFADFEGLRLLISMRNTIMKVDKS